MPKFPKGSQEAKDYMKSLRDKRGTKPKDPTAPKKLTKRQKELTETVDIPIMNSSTLILPEYFATPIKNDKYKLVNPMSQERNLSKRKGKPSLKVVRKPVENMVLLEGNDDPIPLAKFSKRDRIIIDNHFQVVEKYKEKEPKDVPTIYHPKPLERGRPEKLPRNIQINKERAKKTKTPITKNIKLKVTRTKPIPPVVEEPIYETPEEPPVDQPNIQMTIQEVKNKGRPTKYETAEEKAKNKRIQTLASNKKKRAERKALKEQAKQQQGSGILEQVQHFVFGNEGLPTKTKNMLKKYGNEKIQSTYLIRTPVPKYITELLNVASLGDFNKKIKEANYDKLFHLAIVFKTSKGEILLEKNENINMTESIPKVEGTETQDLNLSQDITINEVLERTKKYMSNDKFLKYDASTNNCQDFILSILKANGLGNKTDEAFVKQDIESLFKSSPYLKPLTKNILDIANRFTGTGMTNYKVQSVIFDKDKYTLQSAKDWLKTNGYKQPKVDETEDNLRFRQKDPDVLESRGFTEYRTKPLGKSGIQLIIAYYKSDMEGRGGGNTTMRESDSNFESVLNSQPPTDRLNSEYLKQREQDLKLERLLMEQDIALFYLNNMGLDAIEKERKKDKAFEYLRQKGENAKTLTPEQILAINFKKADEKSKVINGRGNTASVYKPLKLLELFKGTGSVGKVAKKLKLDNVSLDFVEKYKPDILTDILEWDYKKWSNENDYVPDLIWASPPCNTYSPLAYPLKERNHKTAVPYSDRAKLGTKILYKTLEIIDYFKSKNPHLLFVIENPKGMMRNDKKMKKLQLNTTLYCLYGDIKRKLTDFFSNVPNTLKLKEVDSCPNPDIIKSVVDLKSIEERYSIPSKLIKDILNRMIEEYKKPK